MTDTCLDLYKNLNIMIVDGDTHVSPCCYYSPGDKVQTIDFVNNQYLKKIREQVKEGNWPDTCKK